MKPIELGAFKKGFHEPRPLMGQDPYVANYKGDYYMSESINESQIAVSKLSSLGNPQRQNSFVVWDEPSEFQVWAPELHQIDGHWYIYYTASNGNNHFHRTYVLGAASNPFGPYHFKERLGPDVWGIDMTTFKWQGRRYAVWSGWKNNGDEFPQNLYIAEMESPVEIGERILLASPYLEWQQSIAPILEGPQAFIHEDKLFLLYSANASWKPEYATGVLELRGRNPLNPLHWLECPWPLATNVGHGMIRDDYFIFHRKMSLFPGWSDREIVTIPAGELLNGKQFKTFQGKV